MIVMSMRSAPQIHVSFVTDGHHIAEFYMDVFDAATFDKYRLLLNANRELVCAATTVKIWVDSHVNGKCYVYEYTPDEYFSLTHHDLVKRVNQSVEDDRKHLVVRSFGDNFFQRVARVKCEEEKVEYEDGLKYVEQAIPKLFPDKLEFTFDAPDPDGEYKYEISPIDFCLIALNHFIKERNV